MINTILFDLDGTLLPLEETAFINTYFGLLAKRFTKLGFNPEEFIHAIWSGTMSMIHNDGNASNEQIFWQEFKSLIKGEEQLFQTQFLEFYQKDFDAVQAVTQSTPLAAKCISLLKEKGYQVVLATNPVFPKIATYKRIMWAGLAPTDFSHITVYENSSFCKPNIKYYESILQLINKKPEECMMVGNDVTEDMVAVNIGIETFLLTDHLINSKNLDISQYRHGNFESLYQFLNSLPQVKY
jgi:HAD superfamily hydrolase (TIGR01549 family)